MCRIDRRSGGAHGCGLCPIAARGSIGSYLGAHLLDRLAEEVGEQVGGRATGRSPEEHHADTDGLWLQFAKKGSGATSITPQEAVDVVGLRGRPAQQQLSR